MISRHDAVAICARIQSDRRAGDAGWLHRLNGNHCRKPASAVAQPLPETNAGQYVEMHKCGIQRIAPLAAELGLSVDSLFNIGTFRTHDDAWGFPMRDAERRITGVRLRYPGGMKRSLKGGRDGLFIPTGAVDASCCMITEGPTDCAAALDLGFYAVGRPSCQSGNRIVQQFIAGNKIKRVVIVADNDKPGIEGGERLQAMLGVLSVIYVPPAKDLREFVKIGGTHRVIQAAINDMIWDGKKATYGKRTAG